MDKNTITGFVLIGLILLGFSFYSQKQQTEIRAEKARLDSIAQANAPKVDNEIPFESVKQIDDSLKFENSAAALGKEMAEALVAKEEFYTIENDKMIVTISNKGGAIVAVELKDYTDYKGDKLMLFDKDGAKFDMGLHLKEYINSSDYSFKLVNKNANSASLRLYSDSISYIEYKYNIENEKYLVDFDVNMVGMKNKINPATKSITFNWSNIAPQQEKGYKYERQYVTAAYKLAEDNDVEELTPNSDSKKESVEESVSWVGFKQQFFSSIFVADGGFEDGEVAYTAIKEGTGNIASFSSKVSKEYSADIDSYGFNFYFGPNSYSEMKSYDMDFQKLIPLGWGILGWINRFVIIPIFNFLGAHIANYGWIIFFMTIIIKLIIFPFTYKSYVSMAKLRLLKPDIDKLNDKYPDKKDAMKKQQEMMGIYSSAGANPMGGCVPMLFQLPILIAMFRFFPASIELRGESFLWANDLSTYDSILNLPFTIPFYGNHVSMFALLMGISMFISTKVSMAQNPQSSNQQMPGMQMMTTYFMPIMLVVWFNSYSCALSYYYLLSNVITVIQTYVIRMFVDDNKLHAQMQDFAKRPKKKSNWQARYEEMARQQQELKNKK